MPLLRLLTHKTPSIFILAGGLLLLSALAVQASQIDIQGPAGSGAFGDNVTVLPNGNIVVFDPAYSITGGAANVGAVYLYGTGGNLISTLTGSTANDHVGNGGITVLTTGNYVISSPNWSNGNATSAGAATWCSATTGLSGTVSATNSLVGSTTNDQVGNDKATNDLIDNGQSIRVSTIVALSNGSYVVVSPGWNNGATAVVGAVTWCDGTTGTTGPVSTANSLTGTTANDAVGNGGVAILNNGNYVVCSYLWNNGAATQAGAVTWASGKGGTIGAVSAANSIIGSSTGDQVGFGNFTVTALPNGSYSISNRVIALTNGNYVVSSPLWQNNGATNAGAVTWASGSGGTVGPVTASNSLVGSTANDYLGDGSIIALTNGHYVASSPHWHNGNAPNAGAITWGDGTAGINGVVTSDNSLVGAQGYTSVGSGGVIALTNGNYVVSTPQWSEGTKLSYGAVTWGNGATGTAGTVSASNSLTGSTNGDYVGSNGVTALTNGNYVVGSPSWDNGSLVNAGAATWCDGSTATIAVVSLSNSLVGGNSYGYEGTTVTALTNGNYVVVGRLLQNGYTYDAFTWQPGGQNSPGIVSAANSVLGFDAQIVAGSRPRGAVVPLVNGHYIAACDNNDSGAATWCDGTHVTSSVMSITNSLVGTHYGDYIGKSDGYNNAGIEALGDGRYIVNSAFWDNGNSANVGAVTLGFGPAGVIGPVSPVNSVIGTVPADFPSPIWAIPAATGNAAHLRHAYDAGRGQLVVGRSASNTVSLFTPSQVPGISVVKSPSSSLQNGDTVFFDTTTTSRTFTLLNQGLGDLTGIVASVSGDNSADFSVTTSPAATLSGPRGSTALTVTFSPTAGGSRYATLSIASNDTYHNSPFVIQLAAIAPQIAVTFTGSIQSLPTPVANGGELNLGTAVPGITGLVLAGPGISIGNNGTGPLNLTSATISGTNAGDFVVNTTSMLSSVPVGGATSISVTFTPTAVGPRNATLTILSNDHVNGSFTIHLTGTGLAGTPQIAVSLPGPVAVANNGSALDFGTGSAYIGASSGPSATFTVGNTGTAPLTISNIGVSGDNAGDFIVDQSTMVSPVPVAGQTGFKVVFAPQATGSRTATLTITTNDPASGTFTIPLTGTGVATAGTIAFSAPVCTVNQGAVTASLTVTRTGGSLPTSVTINTANGTASALPPFSAAVATGVTATSDYVALSGTATTVSFADGDTLPKTVNITLIPKAGATIPNKRFTATLSAPTAGAALGTSNATVEILAADTNKPTLTVTSPGTSPTLSAASPFSVSGIAGDLHGIASITVKLNAEAAIPASIYGPAPPTAIPYSASIFPVVGKNTLVVTAYDLKGNSTTITRSFVFTQRYIVNVVRDVPAAYSGFEDNAGTVAIVAAPAAIPAVQESTQASPYQVLPGTKITLTATPKPTCAFSHWSGLLAGAVVNGNFVTFTTTAAASAVTAVFVENPFVGAVGTGSGFQGLIHADTGTTSSNSTEGFLTGTLTPVTSTSTGMFTGKILVDGISQAIAASFAVDGSALFTVGATRTSSLAFNNKTLTLSYNAGAGNDQITATLVSGASTSSGIARRSIYTATHKLLVADGLLNASTSGSYTVALPAKTQDSGRGASTYPQGSGYGTLTLTNVGAVAFVGTMADGTAVSASSALVAGNASPMFVQILTPASTTVKGGSFGGAFNFAPSSGSDVTGTNFLWFRPQVAPLNTPATAVYPTHLYSAGWPDGITLDPVGALYSSLLTAQSALTLPAPISTLGNTTGNARLTLTSDKLATSVIKTDFNIIKNAVAKLPSTAPDASFSLTLTSSNGTFSGSFTPSWAAPLTASRTNPSFNGIIIQKGSSLGGFGYFLSNAPGDLAPESGSVTLGK